MNRQLCERLLAHPDLGAREKVLGLLMALSADRNGVMRLDLAAAEQAGISRSAAYRGRQRLEEAGALIRLPACLNGHVRYRFSRRPADRKPAFIAKEGGR